MMHKVVVKVIDNDKFVWKHLCDVPVFVYEDFVKHVPPLKFNSYLYVWARRDFNRVIPMTHAHHIMELKQAIIQEYRKVYSELYAFQDNDLIPYEPFWVSYWVTSHMEVQYDHSS